MSTLRSDLIRLAHQNPEIRPRLLPLLAGRTASHHWQMSDDEPVLELKDGTKLLVATMQAPRLTRKKSEPIRYEYIVMLVGRKWRGDDFLDNRGEPTDQQFRFETVEAAKKAAEKFADRKHG